MHFSLIFASVCCEVRWCVGQPGGCSPDVMSFCQPGQEAAASVLQDLFEWGLCNNPGCSAASGPQILWLLEPQKLLNPPACGRGEATASTRGVPPLQRGGGCVKPPLTTWGLAGLMVVTYERGDGSSSVVIVAWDW